MYRIISRRQPLFSSHICALIQTKCPNTEPCQDCIALKGEVFVCA